MTKYEFVCICNATNRILSKEPDQQHEVERVELISLNTIIEELALGKIKTDYRTNILWFSQS